MPPASFGSGILNHFAKVGKKEYGQPKFRPLRGVVTRTASLKTAMVEVPARKFLSKYHCFFKFKKRIMCHDEHQLANIGDEVYITVAPRKISKRKSYFIHSFVRREPGNVWLDIYPEFKLSTTTTKTLKEDRQYKVRKVKLEKVEKRMSVDERELLSK